MSTNTHVTYPWTKRFPFAVILLVVGLILFLAVTVPQPVVRFAASGSGIVPSGRGPMFRSSAPFLLTMSTNSSISVSGDLMLAGSVWHHDCQSMESSLSHLKGVILSIRPRSRSSMAAR